MISQILLCSDGSDHALRAAESAGELAGKFGAKVTVISAFTPPVMPLPVANMPGMTPYIDIESYDLMRNAFHDSVEEKTGAVLSKLGVKFDARREMGQPVEAILEAAKELKADLIAIGSRGLGGFQTLLLGSVSHGVAHHAHCPVLIVR